MKMIKLLKLRTLMLMLVISSAMILGVGSCNNDDDDDDSNGGGGDKTALTKLITTADSLANLATTTDYPQADIDTYKAKLSSVKVEAAKDLTQVQVSNLITQLNAALTTFKSKGFAFIDESMYLVAGWRFDEGTGTTATSYSTGKQVGTFTKGWTTLLGAEAALPTWVDGVKGGKAIYLTKGAHLQVPYSPSFLPASISIAAWIKMDKPAWENNAIVSQNYWWGYKFQTQGTGRPLFTERINATTVADQDATVAVDPNVWTHVVVALNSTEKTLKFYIDGDLVKTYTEADNVAPLTQTLSFVDGDYTYTAQPFLIGSFATDAEIALHPNNFSWITAANVGSFEGAIDELKLYNTALIDGQVKKLYNDEKP